MCNYEGCNLMIHAIEFADEPCTDVVGVSVTGVSHFN